jgi:hypothetical protein
MVGDLMRPFRHSGKHRHSGLDPKSSQAKADCPPMNADERRWGGA